MMHKWTIHPPWLLAIAAVTSTACASDSLHALRTKTDEFTQNTAAMVDILWVVDNSESMGEEQAGLGQSFNAFMGSLVNSGVDYHVGVISTDLADGGRLHYGSGMPPFIDSTTPDPQAAFTENVKVGTVGSRQEQGFLAAATALGRGIGWNPSTPEPVPVPDPGFLRRGYCSGTCEGTDIACTTSADCTPAALFLIFVSDEDDKSFGPVKYYWRLFKSYFGPGDEARIKISAIAGPVPAAGSDEEGGCFSSGRGSAQPGYRYADLLSQTTNGTPAEQMVTSICDDFNEALTGLSITAAGLAAKFKLSSLADVRGQIDCEGLPPGPFCVKVQGAPVVNDPNGRDGWVYEQSTNSIVFGVNALPRPQAKITVEYQELPQ